MPLQTPSGSKSRKCFQAIQGDYRFFEEHSTERKECLRIWRSHLDTVRSQPKELRILDFGCGGGTFTSEVLGQLGRLPESLRLALVEPVADALRQARAACQPRLAHPVHGAAGLEALPSCGEFDLILSHHVLYYVDPLEHTLRGLTGRLAPGGRALLVVSGQSSIGQLQGEILQRAGVESPYHSGISVKESLEKLASVEVEPFTSELRMADTRANRNLILRFLVGEFRARIDWQDALDAFAPFSRQGSIVMPNQELNLVVQATPVSRPPGTCMS